MTPDVQRAPVAFVRRSAVRRVARALLWTATGIYFGFVALVLILRYSILPNIEHYRPAIERMAGEAMQQTVSIGRIEASWAGINPDLTLLDVRVDDREGRPAIAFSRVEAVLSWWSVPTGQLRLRLLRIEEPTLNIRRDKDGRFSVAGIPVSNEEREGGSVSKWIFAQKHIRILGATVVWEDDLRGAPALVLEDLNFALDNESGHHRFGLTAMPPAELASRIDVRGDFRGTDIGEMELGSGQAYAEIEYADLAVWRQWVDYPFALPYGRGALRAWLAIVRGELREITADVSLEDVNLRLAKDLPPIDLDRMSGRIGARFSDTGFEADGRRVELRTRAAESGAERREAIVIEPTDFHVKWQPLTDGKRVAGAANASRLDLEALARLAGYLPLDAQSRQLLSEYAPSGRVRDLNVKWEGDADRLYTYSGKAGFEQLELKANGYFPGFSGLSGTLEATEKGGTAVLDAKASTLDLPTVFPVPLIALDTLKAQARWRLESGELTVELPHAEFAGPEAAGSAQGTYRTTGEGPGHIDMTAELTRGDARAVWRYMPHVVGAGARKWLHESLVSGYAPEAHLTLKGDLRDFPFLDKRKGVFLVTVKARDVVLDYAKGWPRIEGIEGDLRFEGAGMVVDAHRGAILGAKLSNTRAEIPDFDAPTSVLHIKGKADGATAEFLKFVEQSPVGERIDHFTEDMRASGNGSLDLRLSIPLDEAKLDDSKIDGTFRFANNEVTVDPGLPAIGQVNGSLQFSGRDLRIPDINANFLGGPLKIRGGTQKDGRVLITANGTADIAQLRRQVNSPLLARLSGATPYRGEVRVNKRNADLVIESSLVGIASTFPEPLSKSAETLLPLRFEKRSLVGDEKLSATDSAAAVARDQIDVALGDKMAIRLNRRKQAEGFVPERGAIAVGRPLQLPESGVVAGITVSRLDTDAWRRALSTPSGSGSGGDERGGFGLNAVNLKANEFIVFGHQLDDVDMTASAVRGGDWKIRLNARQAAGDLEWDSAGNGRVTARLRHLTLSDSGASQATATPTTNAEQTERLPALDIVADDFVLGKKRFGRLELQARNEARIWRLDKVEMTNPNGRLTGSGQWQSGNGTSRTQLAFRIESDDVGKLLDRVGYPETVRSGSAQLEGRIGWNGAPTDFDYPSLNGDIKLEASKGQFVKLDPGATGKLLGLISLQGLPRRISLDFKDVFSEGLAFDSITSKVAVRSGVMRTDRLQIDSTSARVVMRGEVDLQRETQHLNVNVQPELGGTAALGVALVNPVAGVATLLAHKILQNPLNHMFGYEYLVTGTWDDPKVERVARTEPTLLPRLPTIPNTSGNSDESSAK